MTATITTALLAVLVFVLTQSFLKGVLEPIQDQRKLIGEIAYALLFYANVYHPSGWEPPDERRQEELDEAKKTLRGLAGRLHESLWTIPFYDTLARLRVVRKRADVLAASAALVGWSNSLYGDRDDARDKRQTTIAEKLGISKKIEDR